MSDRDSKLEQLGYPPERTSPEGSLVEGVMIDGNTIYASGQVPFDGETLTSRGKVPSQVSMEQATEAAALCAANVLRTVRKHFGSLDGLRVARIGYTAKDLSSRVVSMTDRSNVLSSAFSTLRSFSATSRASWGSHAR